MKKSILFLALTLAFACHKEETAVPDIFIFGTAYGMCIDASYCVDLFKLENQSLYADDNATYTSIAWPNTPFQTTSLPAGKVSLAQNLQSQIPAALYGEADGQIGCPDCHDQGICVVIVKTGDTVREWFIDPEEPKYAVFCDSLRATVGQIK